MTSTDKQQQVISRIAPARRRRRVVVGGAVVVALAMTAACSRGSSDSASSSGTSATATTPGTSKATSKSAPTSAAAPSGNPLTGGSKTANPVMAVKLENTPAAMPQYGLSDADLVFVERVEGNLTRLMPVYQTTFPKKIEPVRSARTTELDILPMFGHPALVYSGIASQIRKKLAKAPITSITKGKRDPHRSAPHNLYVDLDQLSKAPGLATSKPIGLGFSTSDPRLAKAGPATSFTEKVGGDRFSFSYKGNRYLPSWNGRPYADAGAGGKQVTASNVVVLKVRTGSDDYKDPAGNPVTKSLTTGSGKLTLYRNGKKLSGSWHRSATSQPFQLQDEQGKQLLLAPGKSWILLQP